MSELAVLLVQGGQRALEELHTAGHARERFGQGDARTAGVSQKGRGQFVGSWRSFGRRFAAAAPQHGHEGVGVEGLADVLVHAGVQAGLALGVQGAGGHGDDGQGEAELAAQQPGGGGAVHHGHLDVHQHGVKAAVPAGSVRAGSGPVGRRPPG